jgi:plasmid maintenance system antidote protein VapI
MVPKPLPFCIPAAGLAINFSLSPELWLNLQSDYDLRIAKRNTELHIMPLKMAA